MLTPTPPIWDHEFKAAFIKISFNMTNSGRLFGNPGGFVEIPESTGLHNAEVMLY